MVAALKLHNKICMFSLFLIFLFICLLIYLLFTFFIIFYFYIFVDFIHSGTDLLAELEGYEVKTDGDAFMYAFSDSFNAVNFCMRTQLGTQSLLPLSFLFFFFH